MKVANVSAVSLKNNKKTQENKQTRTQDLTSFGHSNTTNSVTSKQASDAIKSNFLSNVSFGGHKEEFSYPKRQYGGGYNYNDYNNYIHGTSGAVHTILSDPFEEVSTYKIRDYYSETPQDLIREDLIKHSSFYHETSSIEKTNNDYTTNRVYFADPEEVVNEQTKRDHDYIVYDNYTDIPSLAEVSENYFNTNIDAKNYGQTFKNVAEFHYRREIADKKELDKLQKEKEPIQKDYDLSLEYKKSLEEKINKFPWQVDSIRKDKEKADYFYTINKEKLDNINQKIGYYTDRISYSKHRQELAIQGFKIFDEVGLMFMDRDNIRHKIESKQNSINYSKRVIEYQNKNIKEYTERKVATEEEMSVLSALIKVNNKKIIKINENLKTSDSSQTYSLNQEKKDIEQENTKLTYKVTELNNDLGKINKELQKSQNIKKEEETIIINIEKEIPPLQKAFEQKSKEIQSYYHKMQDFYKQNSLN